MSEHQQGVKPLRWLNRTAYTACAALTRGILPSLPPDPSRAAAQARWAPGGHGCPDCRIVLDVVASIGGPDGPGVEVVSEYSVLAMDRRGRILVASMAYAQDHIAVFDSTGRFLRTVGRSGEGPGEYRLITHLDAGPRFIHVFDHSSQRRTLLDYDFNVVRTDHVPGQVRSSKVFDSDLILFNATLATPGGAGHPLHLLDTDGRMRSFGEDRAVSWGAMPVLFVDGAGDRFWAVFNKRYEVAEWDLAGPRRVGTQSKEAPWFDSDASPADPQIPPALLKGIRISPDLVWVAGSAVDRRWRGRAMDDRGPMPPWAEIWDGVLDVYDRGSGRLLAHGRWDEAWVGFVGGSSFLARYREDDSGAPWIDILQARLATAGGEGPTDQEDQ